MIYFACRLQKINMGEIMGELQLQRIRRIGLKATRRMPLLLWSLWIVLPVELLSRGRLSDTLSWSFHAWPELVLNSLIVLSMLLLLAGATGSVRWSFWLVASVCLLFALISGIKLDILGVPFLPWDLLLTSETKDMASYLRGLLNMTVVTCIITFIAVSLVLLYKLPRIDWRLNWKRRIVVVALSIGLFASVCSNEGLSLKRLAHVHNLAWDQTENIKTNGFLLSTLMNMEYLFQEEPEGYNADSIQAIVSSVPKAVPEPGQIKPNIIVILSESFWDATQIEGLKFSRDPLPFYHSLVSKYTSGELLSPQYGGGTANVEFEVLTGNSMRFLPQGSVPYNQHVSHPIDSLASILRREGYATTAINPFHSWFYNSKHVYRHFGFSKYISQEFMEPDYEGPYLADRLVAKYVIESTERTPGPDFIFANTMENHYHYYPGKFKENTIEVTGVTGESKGLFETYAQGLTGADEMLKQLVSHYERKGEPTIIVFFGDHMPSLGDNYKAYIDSGYLKENDPDFLEKMYRVPVLVWNNYLPEHKDELNMSPSFLGPYVLKLAQRQGSYYTDYLYQLAQKTPVIPPKNYYAEMGISEEALKVYEKLQYDIIFGKQYAYGDWKQTIRDEHFVLGLGKMVIEDVKLEAEGAERRLKVIGREFPHNSIVTINGNPVETVWNNTRELSCKIDPDSAQRTPWNIEVVVKDSKDFVVARTNEYSQTQFAVSAQSE